jgi:hypothetical protein
MADMDRNNIPTPDLRILPVSTLHPHEEHDSQRSEPLIDRIRTEDTMINPPLVAPINDDQFVILDGANRVHAFCELGYPHILAQVASYDSGLVELSTWQHVVAAWNEAQFIQHLGQIPEIALQNGQDTDMLAQIILRDGRSLILCAPVTSLQERNAALRNAVGVYQQNARLHRTALTISRHIVHGRAIRVNYPLDALCDPNTPLEQKNANLREWMQKKLANRQIRYYAEATYQFDE